MSAMKFHSKNFSFFSPWTRKSLRRTRKTFFHVVAVNYFSFFSRRGLEKWNFLHFIEVSRGEIFSCHISWENFLLTHLMNRINSWEQLDFLISYFCYFSLFFYFQAMHKTRIDCVQLKIPIETERRVGRKCLAWKCFREFPPTQVRACASSSTDSKT